MPQELARALGLQSMYMKFELKVLDSPCVSEPFNNTIHPASNAT